MSDPMWVIAKALVISFFLGFLLEAFISSLCLRFYFSGRTYYTLCGVAGASLGVLVALALARGVI